MQDAYAAETSKSGDFDGIGYKIPASNVFGYTETYTTDTKEVFTATPSTPLDGISSAWTVTSEKDAKGNTTHDAAMPTGADKLTPNFTAIGRVQADAGE